MRHKIRGRNGGVRAVDLSPLEAIRLQCLECVSWSPKCVTACSSPLCSLYPYREGVNPDE